MEDKNKNVLKIALWGFTMIVVISGFIIFKSLASKDNENRTEQSTEIETPDVIVYDGSENNPYIQGVQ